MRKTHKKQLPLMEPAPAHPKAKEYEKISEILDMNSSIPEIAMQDLTLSKPLSNSGANGMTAEQVVRAAIVKQMEGYSYVDLAFHLEDSLVYRNFLRIGFGDKPFKKSSLQANIKALSAETWEAINRCALTYAKETGVENGGKIRVDCTVVNSNIHAPYDSELLWDSVRVLDRIMRKAKEELGVEFPYNNHTKRAKRRSLGVTNAKNKKMRKAAYMDLLKVTKKVITLGKGAVDALQQPIATDYVDFALAYGFCEELQYYLRLARQVVEQTERRVVNEESVPADEKIVSIFEEHTDIIVKDRRETHYGHKVCLSGGASNLITDCMILDGNPADSTLPAEVFERQREIYGRSPLKVALDGGFASRSNLQDAKEQGIKDVCFSKGKGLDKEEMCRSKYVFRKLRNFRAGIESGISRLKRSFGLTRCMWKGLESFKSYVWASIVSANLLTLARAQLT
ncbi:MAG: ISNCY family transposase [Desulfobulbaceae bacterium]|nr:ISNCY family transposase [Desulfobulbaceae bacterium]